MIVGIEGKVVKKEPTHLHIRVNGLTYEVFVSLHTSASIKSDTVTLHTTRIIREDSDTLYGFLGKNEKKMFDTLIKINGVGPKVAMAICSTFTPETFTRIVTAKDASLLKKVPGIGPKAASRILVELGDLDLYEAHEDDTRCHDSYNEAFLALETLGFKKEAIAKALDGVEQEDTASMVKAALRKLQRL